MSEDPSAAPGQPPSRAGFLLTALGKIKSNLDLFLGTPLGLSPSEPCETTGAEIAGRLPPSSVVFGVRASGAVDAEMHCVVAEPLVLAMSLIARHQSPEAIEARLAAATAMDDAERASVKEIGSFITAALGDFAKESTGGRVVLAPLELRLLAGGETPPWNVADPCVVLESGTELASAPAGAILLIAPATVVAVWAAPEPVSVFGGGRKDASASASPAGSASSEPDAAPDSGLEALWAAGREPFLAGVKAAAGTGLAVHTIPTIAELIVAAGSASPPALLVLEVPSGGDFELAMIAALRHHPVLGRVPTMVALESPSRNAVVRCGSLGIRDVIPAALAQQALSERLQAAVRERLPALAR